MPGTPGLEHRIGGIEKADGIGTISYDPANHDRMVRLRQAKVDGIAASLAPLEVDDPDGDARGAGARMGLDLRPHRRGVPAGARAAGARVAQAHLRHLNPFPPGTGEVLRRYDKVVVPEMNLGQLACCCARATSWTPSATTRSVACRSRPRNSPGCSAALIDSRDVVPL